MYDEDECDDGEENDYNEERQHRPQVVTAAAAAV